jgi:HEAT repeat protein
LEETIEGSQGETNATKEAIEAFWRKFLESADNKECDIAESKGFFLALRDCLIAKKSEFSIPDFLEDELAKRAGLNPETIKKYRLEQRIKQLIRRLNSSETTDRINAAKVIRDIGPVAKAAVPTLIKALTTDGHQGVRQYVAQALREIGSEAKAAVPALIKALETDEWEQVRWYAAAALGEIGPDAKEAVPALTKAMELDKDNSVRWRAAEAIERINSTSDKSH